MVKHIVFWKVKDNDDKQNNIDRMIEMLTSLVGKIDGLVSLETGYNFNTSSDYDVALYATFKNPAALKYYQNHPEHVKCKDFIAQVTVDRTAVDYFFEDNLSASRPISEVPDAPAEEISEPKTEVKTIPEITIEKPIVHTAEATPVEETPVADVQPTPVEETPVAETTTNPFGIEINTGNNPESSLPNIAPDDQKKVSEEFVQQFEDVQPSVQGYNPQIKTEEQFSENQPAPEQNYQAPDLSFIKSQGNVFAKQSKFDNNLNDQANTNYAQPLEPLDFSNTPPAAPMRFDPDSSSYNFGVGSNTNPKPQPMKFSDTPVSTPISTSNPTPAPQRRTRPTPTAKPAPAAKTPDHAQVNPVSTEHSKFKETTSVFGKKKLDVDVTPLEQRSDTWTCPNCGKIMPKYVGTCGCGEVQPFDFDDAPAAPVSQPAPMTYNNRTPATKSNAPAAKTPDHAQVNPVSTEHSKFKETTSVFGKKKLDVDVTPLEQRSDTWTCPNCGKIMPKYVGTCGCGEVQPFDFDDTPAAPVSQPAPMTYNNRTPATKSNAPAAKTPDHAQVNPVSTEHSKFKETTSVFGKKKLDVDVTPLEQRSDTWTCPNCGKIMPKYVGTCGCGEVQPFDFDDTPATPVSQPAPMTYNRTPATKSNAPAAKTPDHAQVNPVSTEHSKFKETTSVFGKKKLDVDVTPLEQRSDTWTCPNCGKIMPKYVGTCGCGEVQPFDFDDTPAAPVSQPAPTTYNRTPATKSNAPAAKTPDHAQVNPVSTEHSKFKETTSVFGKKKLDVDVTPLEQRSDTWTCPNCGKIMPKYVGTCGCGEVQPFDFDDAPAAPVSQPAPMTYNNRTPATKSNAPAAKTPDHAQVNPVSTEHSKFKETTSVFGKKKLDVDVTPLEQRADTWTCPNCGKIMPKYVGTCGCGEPQPFEF